MKIWIQIFCLLFGSFTFASSFEQPERLVAIGDIHGDGYALEKILKEMKLINAEGNWGGGKTHLMFMGDLLDRGLSSRKALDLLIDLQKQAPLRGGKVTSVMGNHELMVVRSDLRYFAKRDALNYLDFARGDERDLKKIVQNAFQPSTKYGQWIDSLPAIIAVDKTLFMHAGIEKWILSHSIEKVNELVSRWLGFFRGLNPRPSEQTEWVIGADGPLWTREIANGRISKKMFSLWLKQSGYERVVVGHTITPKEKATFSPIYGDQLVMIDTAISSGIGGRLSAMEWVKGRPIQFHHFDRDLDIPEGYKKEDLLFNEGDGIDPMKEKVPRVIQDNTGIETETN